jgi:hypothetical protein
MVCEDKPTIAELEEILSKEDDYYKVEIKPNGEVIAVTNAEHLESLLIQRGKEIERLGEALSDEQAAHQATSESLRLTYTEEEERLQAKLDKLQKDYDTLKERDKFIREQYQKIQDFVIYNKLWKDQPDTKSHADITIELAEQCKVKLSRCHEAIENTIDDVDTVLHGLGNYLDLSKHEFPGPPTSAIALCKQIITTLDEVLKEKP